MSSENVLLLKAIILLALGFAALVLMFLYTWPAMKVTLQDLWVSLKKLPDDVRCAFDEERRRRRDTVKFYEVIVSQLVLLDALQRQASRAARQDDNRRAERDLDEAAESLSRWREVAVQYLSNLPDEQIDVIADWKANELYEGKVDAEIIANFLREERDLARRQPSLVRQHLVRELELVAPFIRGAAGK